jgi:NitT/TauT family transport system substrate-binding protein
MGTVKRIASIMGVITLFAVSSAQAAEPVTIRMSWVAPVANWASIWLEKKDLARHFGKSYVMEPVHFSSSSAMITGQASGDLDIANYAFSTFALAIVNAKMDDLRVIGEEFQDGVPGYYSNEYFVLKDSPIKTVEDLKGKVLATNGGGSAVDITMRAMLVKHHLDPDKDVSFVQAPLPAVGSMLAGQKVDLVPGVLPFSLDPHLRAIARPLFTQREALGITQMLVLCAHKSFIDAHRAAMVDFMEDTLRIMHWFVDPKNHAEAVAIAANVVKVPPDRMDWVYTHQDYYRDPNMIPNLAALQRNIDLTQQLGLVSANVDVKAHTDLSLIKEAMARLK